MNAGNPLVGQNSGLNFGISTKQGSILRSVGALKTNCHFLYYHAEKSIGSQFTHLLYRVKLPA